MTANNFQSYGVDQTVQVYAGTAARGSAIGTAVSEGMVSYLADSNVVQAYDGAAWNSLAYQSAVSAIPRVGLVPIVATSISASSGSATLDTTTGLVSFTNAGTISLNGVFSSTYRHYRLIVDANIVTNSGIGVRYRTAGTDNSSNVYYQYWTIKRISGVLQDNSGGPSTVYNLIAGTTGTTWTSWAGEIYNPYNSSMRTVASGQGFGNDSTNSYMANTSILFDNTTTFDGISLLTNGITGTVKIYGYN